MTHKLNFIMELWHVCYKFYGNRKNNQMGGINIKFIVIIIVTIRHSLAKICVQIDMW